MEKTVSSRPCVHTKSLRSCHVWLFAILWTKACLAPLFMGFSKQESWSGLPCPLPGDLPDPGIKPMSFMSPELASGFFTTSANWESNSRLETANSKKGLHESWAIGWSMGTCIWGTFPPLLELAMPKLCAHTMWFWPNTCVPSETLNIDTYQANRTMWLDFLGSESPVSFPSSHVVTIFLLEGLGRSSETLLGEARLRKLECDSPQMSAHLSVSFADPALHPFTLINLGCEYAYTQSYESLNPPPNLTTVLWPWHSFHILSVK